ncbi:MAG: lipoprotein-releasing ABC transporter permease subunit [Pseudomonadales bacterium]|nr:lipoprotein-releasing ABC transporter permease subunit [Pseudomonadales bacterium]
MLSNWRVMVALRYTGSRAGDSLLSFMSFFSVAGLVLGVAVLVIVLSVMNGFERELRLRVLAVLPHAVIFKEGGYTHPDLARAEILSHPEVLGTSVYTEGAGLVVANHLIRGVSFTGIDPVTEAEVSDLSAYMQAGAVADLVPGKFGVLIGEQLSRETGVGPGERISLVLPQARMTLAGPVPRSKRFTVTGVFRTGTDADKTGLVMHWQDAVRLTGRQQVDGIRLKVRDLFTVYEYIPQIMRSMDGRNMFASTWMHRYGNLYDAIQVQKSTMFFLLMILVAVAAFNVISNLVMTVNDKAGDIAILRTMGATNRSVMWLFVIHGGLVGLLGVVLGMLVGVTITVSLSDIYQVLENRLGLHLMDEYFVHYLPTEILAGDLFMIGGVSMIICLLATLYPARQAAQANPVEALQYES